MIFQSLHEMNERIDLQTRFTNDTSVSYYYYSYVQYSLCEDTNGDFIVPIVGVPVIVLGVLLATFYLVSSLLNRDLFSRTFLFEDAFVCTNSINFVVTSVAVVEFMTHECWNASSGACKLAVWSSEITATGAIGFLMLVVTDAYHPWIRNFFARQVRKCIAVIAVCVASFFFTVPEVFLVGVKDLWGDKFCIFTADIPSRYKLVLKKDLLIEYVLPILITLCILAHALVVLSRGRRVEEQTASPSTFNESTSSLGGNIFLEHTSSAAQGIENYGRRNYTALVLGISFLLLKTPHHLVTFVDAFEISFQSFEIRIAFDFVELIACIIFAGIAPLLVLTGSTTQRRRAHKTFQIMKTFLSGRKWQQGFEMDLTNDL